jgi:hypothetical protein
MTIKERIDKPDNPFWRKVGNFAVIIAGPVGTLAILIFVPAPFKEPGIAAWSAIVAGIKAASKLTVK